VVDNLQFLWITIDGAGLSWWFLWISATGIL
jgi:hypothetical protein